MDPEAVRRTLEPTASPTDITGSTPYDSFVISGLRLDAAEHGRVLCSFVVTPRLASPQGYLLSGVKATLADQLGSAVFYSSGVGFSGVSLEISVSYVDTATIGSPQGYLLSGVTATLADQLGSAVFYSSGVGLIGVSSGVGLSGVSLEINISYVDTATVGEEIEVEAKLLRAGKSVGVVSVDFRKKRTGKLMAQARHTKYLALSSKL